VLENQNLQFENKQLNLLLKEYEQTLEGVMSKFRAVSVGINIASCVARGDVLNGSTNLHLP
jgi:small ligand-binding sensory domain FIST